MDTSTNSPLGELGNDALSAIAEMQALFDSVKKFVEGDDVNIPELEIKLDVESRQGNPKRIFKHIQQMCNIHVTALTMTNLIKLLYLIDGYITMILAKNPAGIFSMSRSLL